MGAHENLSSEDREALGQLVVEHAWRVDHGHADTVHELFTQDATLALGGSPMEGRDAIKAWGAGRATQDRATRHVISNMRFVGAGPDQATGTVVLTVYLHDGAGDGTTMPMSVGEYVDEYVKQDGTWLFSKRGTEIVFSRH